MIDNYVVYHLHDDYQLLDSCTKYTDYVDKAVELGQKAIAFTNHGNIYNWASKKEYCDKKGIKYIHGCEVYLTALLEIGENNKRVRDNYHTILLAKNFDGLLEINSLVSKSCQPDHYYYKPRISFDEFFNISDNVIKISACLAGPLSKVPYEIKRLSDKDKREEWEEELLNKLVESLERLYEKYDYYEVQYHNESNQILYNKHLHEEAIKRGKKLIAGTDTHSLNKYKQECRKILMDAKDISFGDDEFQFDLTYKSFDELLNEFKEQNSLPEEVYLDAINNTNIMADSIEDFTLDKTIKYPKISEDDDALFHKRVWEMFDDKVKRGVIPQEQVPQFVEDIKEECRVFDKVKMNTFMLSMSKIICWCREKKIPLGFARGSSGGSRVAYVLDIIDINPVKWGTLFSRFCNENRTEIGDWCYHAVTVIW